MTQIAKLTASDGVTDNDFGGAVAISGRTIVVGASRATRFPNHNRGAAYVFVEPDGGRTKMTETAELKFPHDESNSGYFGTGVATDGTTVAVGWTNYLFRSAVYMFVEPASGWETGMAYQAELTATSGVFGVYDGFGSYLALSGGTLVVGAPSEFSYPVPGAAYVFAEPPGGWVSTGQTATLTASNGGNRDYFGSSVAIQGDSIAVGAPDARWSYGPGPGGVYVFLEPAGGWADMTETAELRASDGQKGDQLGSAVAFDGTGQTLWAGASGHNSGQGAVYVFAEPKAGWSTTSKFNAEIASPVGSSFGASLSIFGDVEAITGDTAAYIFGPE